MYIVPFGEQSPRVTLLQVLLNSHGCVGVDRKRLVVDGVYGRNTKAAVASASRLMGVGDQSGKAAMPPLIKAVNVFVANLDDPIVLGGMCNGLLEMVRQVQTRARAGRVATLRLDGHGNLGRWLTISVGDIADLKGRAYQEIAAEEMSYVSSTNFDKVKTVIAPLGRIFAPFGFAEHLGCTLGARPLTRAMLRKLADLWGVPIRVGIQTQPIGSPLTIHGPAFTAYPKGYTLSTWSKQFQALDLPGVSQLQSSSYAYGR